MKAVNKYFHSLSNLGYKKDREVYKLLALLFIEELLSSPLAEFITELDYKDITDALYCILGTSCMLSYPDYVNGYDVSIHSMPDEYRISEDSVLRVTEDNTLRVVI